MPLPFPSPASPYPCYSCGSVTSNSSPSSRLTTKVVSRDTRPSNSTSSGNVVAKITVSNASPPPYDSPESDIMRLFHAVAVPHRSCSAECPSTTHEHVLQAQADSDPQSVEDGWIIDSGASRNMCARRDWFHHYSLLTSPIDVVLSDNSAIQAGNGTGITHRYPHRSKRAQDHPNRPRNEGDMVKILF